MVDELDIKLHPLILRALVKYFHNGKLNPDEAQIIFSAHNIVALNGQDMRTDEIYFVSKEENGYSSVERLSGDGLDIETIITDKEYGKAYLAGRFGAIPEKFVL
jgi:hypothetical protein